MGNIKAKVAEPIKLNALNRAGYAGMISPTIFSITTVNGGNYFYPVSSTTVSLFGKNYKVIKVDEREIELQLQTS